MHKQLIGAAKAFERSLFAGIDEGQRAELRRTLDQIRSNLDKSRS
jgi:hypothetical protein